MVQHEAKLQKSCVKWFDLQYKPEDAILFHVPNGGKRNAIEAAKFKAMGTRPGVPDLICFHKGQTFAIEMKYGKGKLTENQKRFHKYMEGHSIEVYTISSFDDFKELIESKVMVKEIKKELA